MMRRFAGFAPNFASKQAALKHAARGTLTALAAVLLIVCCGMGAAAFAGLLPASEGVATAVTATPLEDMQTRLPTLVEPRSADASATAD